MQYDVSYVITFYQRLWFQIHMQGKMIPPGLEPGNLRVLGARDNHYTTESTSMRREVLDVRSAQD